MSIQHPKITRRSMLSHMAATTAAAAVWSSRSEAANNAPTPRERSLVWDVHVHLSGVTGTPAFFINGIPLKGARDADDLSRVVDAELDRLRPES